MPSLSGPLEPFVLMVLTNSVGNPGKQTNSSSILTSSGFLEKSVITVTVYDFRGPSTNHKQLLCTLTWLSPWQLGYWEGRGACYPSSFVFCRRTHCGMGPRNILLGRKERGELDLMLLYPRVLMWSHKARGPQPGCSTEPSGRRSSAVFGVRSRLALVASISVSATLAWKCKYLWISYLFPPRRANRKWGPLANAELEQANI